MLDLVEKLKHLDLRKVNFADLEKVANASIRQTLLDLAQSGDLVGSLSHQNHTSHADHSTSPGSGSPGSGG